MSRETMIHMLLAMRSQIDSMLAYLAEEDMKEMEKKPPVCNHPPTKRKSYSTMGGPEEWVCLECGFHYNENEQ